jgi:hypothetical protein
MVGISDNLAGDAQPKKPRTFPAEYAGANPIRPSRKLEQKLAKRAKETT